MTTQPAAQPPLLSLTPLRLSSLPPPTDPLPFITTLLTTTLPFISSLPSILPSKTLSLSTSPSPTWKSLGSVPSPPSTSPVSLYTSPSWACRQSLHPDSEATPGSASYSEFKTGLKDLHATAEAEYTPSIVAHKTLRTWDIPSTAVVEVGGQTWGDITMKIEEARHAIGRPVLRDRVFGVVQVTATRLHGRVEEERGEDGREDRRVGGGEDARGEEGKENEFVLISLPLEGETEKGTVRGRYVAVERVRKTEKGEVEWVMATGSDAGGVLPGWMQRKAVPGQIAKDVGLFFGWVAGRRGE